jgi:hypothetical protein
MVSGIIQVNASVTDMAGVASVVGTFAHDYEFTLFPVGGNNYSGSFDTRIAGTEEIFPLIEVRARDEVDNEAVASTVLALDNTRPILDMDPDDVYEYVCVDDGTNGCPQECSQEFDPVGNLAANDGQTLGQLSAFRVRAEDFGNQPKTNQGFVTPLAGLNEGSVEILILDDTSIDLLVDTDGDGVCDDFNPFVVPTTDPPEPGEPLQAHKIGLSAVAVQGNSWTNENLNASAGACYPGLEDTLPPPWIGTTGDARRIPGGLSVSGPYGLREVGNVIFAQGPFDAGNVLGVPFDALLNNMSDGWACVAARGLDDLGNVNVSAPLRVCFDKDGDGQDDTGASLAAQGCDALYGNNGTPPIDCTSDCLLPATFRYAAPGALDGFFRGINTRQCSDQIDNDDDDLTDFGGDPDCTAPNINSEAAAN